jgi:hypothetical protein
VSHFSVLDFYLSVFHFLGDIMATDV